MSSIKEELYNYCLHHIEEQAAAIQQKINDARDAASEDTKSSAGDKYETGREMIQQEIDLNMTRLNEVKKLREIMDHIDPLLKNDIAVPGSIVKTNHGNYYIATSIGKTILDGKIYYIISVASPIGSLLKGCKKGDSFSFNAKEYVIKAVE